MQDPFKIKVSTEMITVPARILSPPSVRYAGSSARIQGASWNLRDVKFAQGAVTDTFGVIVLKDGPHDLFGGSNPTEVANKFRDMCNKSGMRVGGTNAALQKTINLPQDRTPASLEKEFSPAFAAIMAKKPKIILIFLPTSDKGVYAMIKYLGDVKFGISTVCAQTQKISKMSQQYLANVALKFNLKLLGRNHGLQASDLGMLAAGTTMIVRFPKASFAV